MASRTKKEVVTIDVPSRLDLVIVVRMILGTAASSSGALKGDRLEDLRVVASEAVTNAVQANLAAGNKGRVKIRCELQPNLVRLTITDQGPGMGATLPLPDITHPDRLSIEGGFGVPLIEKLSHGRAKFTSSKRGTTVEVELAQ
jgi:serine/threonine-protein kinase RsbW